MPLLSSFTTDSTSQTCPQFINVASADKGGATVSDSLTSTNLEVRHFGVQHPITKRPVIFVEPPGFDHLNVPNGEILAIINEWIKTSSVLPLASCKVC